MVLLMWMPHKFWFGFGWYYPGCNPGLQVNWKSFFAEKSLSVSMFYLLERSLTPVNFLRHYWLKKWTSDYGAFFPKTNSCFQRSISISYMLKLIFHDFWKVWRTLTLICNLNFIEKISIRFLVKFWQNFPAHKKKLG